MEQDEVIGCLLSEAEAARRGDAIARDLQPGVLESRELDDGYAWRFSAAAPWPDRVWQFVSEERRCCPFLTFELRFESHGEALWLSLRGTPAVKEFLRTAFPLAPMP